MLALLALMLALLALMLLLPGLLKLGDWKYWNILSNIS